MKEKNVRVSVLKHLKKEKWFIMPLSDRFASGYPDILCIKEGKHIFIELKKPDGKTRDIQDYFVDEINHNGGMAFVVKSLDQIKNILTNLD